MFSMSRSEAFHLAGFRFTLVSDVLASGGLLMSHLNIVAANPSTPTWINVKASPYNAAGNGSTDDTAAIQAAVNALAAAGGGVLYIPPGNYKVTSTITWTANKSLRILGDGANATSIQRASAASPFHTFDVRNVTGGGVEVEHLNILNTVNAGAFSDDQVGLYFAACNRVRLYGVQINSSANRVNIATEFSNCNEVSVIACDLRGYVNAILSTGNTAVFDVVATTTATNSGSGVPTSGNVALTVSGGTLHLTNVVTNGGDHGLVLLSGTGATPGFVYVHDFEVNNCHGDAVDLNTGAECWFEQLWCSNQSISNSEAAYHGVNVGSSFDGWVVFDNCVFQHYSGHGIWIQGGRSYWITNSSFSGCCGNAADTYDDIHVGGTTSYVTINGNHFDVEPFNSMTPPRSAVYTESGTASVLLDGNTFASSGYGTQTVLDVGGAITYGGNSGYGGTVSLSQSDVTSYTVTAASFTQASRTWPIPAYDGKIGTVYRLTTAGNGRQGSTQETFSAQAAVFGTTAVPRGFVSAIVGASGTFAWRSVIEVEILSTGSSGSALVTTTFYMSQGTTGAGASSASNSSVCVGTQTITGINTTSATTLGLQLEWGATTGSPTATSTRSLFERLGP